MEKGESSMKITVVAAEGCLASAIAGLFDMFSIANMWAASLSGRPEPPFATEIVTPGGQPVLSSGCIQMLPHRALEDALVTDFVLIPPFIPLPDPDRGDTVAVREWIIAHHRRQTPVAAMCTGVFLLAETGLLDGRMATTNWQFARKFTRRFPEVDLHPEYLLTEDDGLICTGAATAYYNLGLRMIGRYGSADLAAACAKALLLDPNRESQTPYFMLPRQRGHNDHEVLKAQRYLEENFSKGGGIDAVARHVRISPRHFKRRFKHATGHAPIQYLQMVRIEAAKKKLETTLETIEEITQYIGYEDSSTFRRLFRQHTKLSPREYRDKFSCV
jgi:transcriptional regulator GlxA family with amidase domain